MKDINDNIRSITSEDVRNDAEQFIDQSNTTDYEFPMEVFPDKIQEIVKEYNKSFMLPSDFYGMSILLISTGLIGNSFKLFVKSGYTEHAILYGAIVGRSSMGKSPVLKMCLRPVEKIEKELSTVFDKELSRWRENKKEGVEDMDDRPKRKDVLINNATLEAVYGSLSNNKQGLIMYQDELMGWIKSLNQYRAGGDVEAWLSINSNSMVKVNRSSSDPFVIHNAAVSVIGGIQPSLLKELGRDKLNNGFMARILFAYPLNQEKPYFSDYETDEVYIDQYEDIMLRLNQLCKDAYSDNEPQFLALTPKAKNLYYTWNHSYTDLINQCNRDSLTAYYGKLQGYCLRIALVLELLNHACDRKENISGIKIESNRIEQAIQLTDYFRRTGERVLNEIEKVGGTHNLNEIQGEFYRKLPTKEFKTEEAILIGELVGMPKRTVQDFIKNQDLFRKVKYGTYSKLYI